MSLSPKQIDEALVKWRPMVCGVAQHFQSRLAASHTIDDTIAIGMAALWEAATLFDAGNAKGASFATWARRIVLHRYLGEVKILNRAKRRIAYHTNTSIDDEYPDGTPVVVLRSPDRDPEELLIQHEADRAIAAARAKLPAKLSHVIAQRIDHDLTLKAIGDDLGLTRERIRQIEAKAIGKLRAELVE